jgi:hypothetical protein
MATVAGGGAARLGDSRRRFLLVRPDHGSGELSLAPIAAQRLTELRMRGVEDGRGLAAGESCVLRALRLHLADVVQEAKAEPAPYPSGMVTSRQARASTPPPLLDAISVHTA